MNINLLKLYNQFTKWPFGKYFFSKIAAQTAPYFSTICPYVSDLKSTGCTVEFKKRRRVFNHLKTVHAIAMCNACELAFGLTMEAGLPKNLRWIPKGMTVRYLKKAETDLSAKCDFPQVTNLTPGDHIVPVKITNNENVVVMEADITVYVSEKQKKN